MSLLSFTEGSNGHRTYRVVGWTLFVLVALAIPFWAVQTPSFSIGDSTFTFSLGNLSHAVAYMVEQRYLVEEDKKLKLGPVAPDVAASKQFAEEIRRYLRQQA